MERIAEIDIARGSAVIGMIIFHAAFIAVFLGVTEIELYEGWWLILARAVQVTFLTTAGVSLAISAQKYRERRNEFYAAQGRRALRILSMALLITIVTAVVVPKWYIVFGILHLIGSGILLLSPLAHRKMAAFVTGILLIVITPLIKTLTTHSLLLTIIGLYNPQFQSLDYFPLVPWLGVIALGIALGNSVYGDGRSPFPKIKGRGALALPALLGRHSLLVYMVHVPILLALISGFAYALLLQ